MFNSSHLLHNTLHTLKLENYKMNNTNKNNSEQNILDENNNNEENGCNGTKCFEVVMKMSISLLVFLFE